MPNEATTPSAHTPGPWQAVKTKTAKQPYWHVSCPTHVVANTAGDCEANARLIAAAPDMLAALKALGPIMADIGYFEGADPAKISANADSLGKQVISSNQRACNAAWAAIAAAEGR